MPLINFALILLALFTIELMGPVQAWVIQPFTAAIAKISAIIVQLFDGTVQAEGNILRNIRDRRSGQHRTRLQRR